MKKCLAVSVLTLIVLVGCSPFANNPLPTEAPTPIVKVSTAVSTLPAATDVPTAQPTAEPTAEDAQLLAYIAPNGNIFLKTLPDGGEQQITSDATANSMVEGVGLVSYSGLAWSFDGALLAFQRDQGKPISEGLDYTMSVQVYNPDTGEVKSLTEQPVLAGFDWRPGTHQIAFGLGTDPNYWVTRGGVDSALAKGIWTVDADSGELAELVKPERGLHLVRPQWSPGGDVLGFEEVEFMEGRGKFAFYDEAAGGYTALEQQVGNYDWMPDGQRIVFDTQVYTATGMERIWVANRDGSGALRISPHYGEGYAFMPVLNLAGDQVAYLAEFGMPEEPGKSDIRLYVQPLEEVEPRELARFVDPAYELAWSPDGSSLLLTTGQYEARSIVQVGLADGSINMLTRGSSPAMQP